MKFKKDISVIDLFCGIGGLTCGLQKAGLKVNAGIDIDQSCKYSYEKSNNTKFIGKNITEIKGDYLIQKIWDKNSIRILVGCAPCQPFSTHSNKIKDEKKKENKKWFLLSEFGRLIKETKPNIVSMENVPNLANKEIFKDFVALLEDNKYYYSFSKVYCPDYGIPQKRRRLVLLASKYAPIKIISKTHGSINYKTTRETIGFLPKVKAGEHTKTDPLHFSSNLSKRNLKRIRSSKPNGTWEDWNEELRLACHKKETGQTYRSVYGRMSWDEPSPTITTQFYNYGTGRFGHPTQDRALTVREAALLQTFPMDYYFYKNEEDLKITKLGVHIGNAVPVDLGYIIGKSICKHIEKNKELINEGI